MLFKKYTIFNKCWVGFKQDHEEKFYVIHSFIPSFVCVELGLVCVLVNTGYPLLATMHAYLGKFSIKVLVICFWEVEENWKT